MQHSYLVPPRSYFRFVRDPRANYKQSLSVLEHVKNVDPFKVTKTSIMLGLGETDDEVLTVMEGTRNSWI